MALKIWKLPVNALSLASIAFVVAVAFVGLGLGMAPSAHADDADFIMFLDNHGMGCGEGAMKCASEADLIKLGHQVCITMDEQDLTTSEAVNRLVDVGDGFINKAGATALVAAAIYNYCPWDQSRIH